MKTWIIRGAMRETGQEVSVRVTAAYQTRAEELTKPCSILVSSIELAEIVDDEREGGFFSPMGMLILVAASVVGFILVLMGLGSALETANLMVKIGSANVVGEAAPALTLAAAGMVTVGVGIIAGCSISKMNR